jgi:cytochrome c
LVTRWRIFVLPLALAACGPSQTTIAAAEDEPADQWSRGVWLYGQHCAGCHGEEGEGGDDTPPLAGNGALPSAPREGSARRSRFDTAADVFTYVKSSMPQLDPGSLTDEQYWAVLAYALKAGGATLGEPPLGAHNAKRIHLH